MSEMIADLPRDDRPRERLLKHGPSTLSNAELVALLLGSGLPGKNAIQLARELLRDGVRALGRRNLSDLSDVLGMGPAKATRIAAAFELSRRMTADEDEVEPPTYDSKVFGSSLIGNFTHHHQERLGAALLDSRHRILKQREVYIGTLNHALVSTRDVVRYALEANAAAIVLYHNHPSGNPRPSEEDMNFTKKISASLGLFDLDLIDHLIIGSTKYYSFKETGLINMK